MLVDGGLTRQSFAFEIDDEAGDLRDAGAVVVEVDAEYAGKLARQRRRGLPESS